MSHVLCLMSYVLCLMSHVLNLMSKYLKDKRMIFFLRINILTILFILINFSLKANDLSAQFKSANTALLEGKYAEAIQLYEKVLLEGRESANLHYNLANAYYRNEKLGRAILHYERAKRLSPSDKKTMHNLKMANTLLSKKIETYPLVFYKRWWLNTIQFFSSGIWAVLALVCVWVSFLAAVYFIINKTPSKKKKTFATAFTLLSLAILFTVFSYYKYQLESNENEAIILKEETPLRSGPSSASKEVTALPEGVKVQIVERLDKWFKVILTNEKEGWVNVKDMEVI